MSGSSLHCLNLMTNDEPDGGLVMTIAGVLPNQEVVADGPVVVAEVDVVVADVVVVAAAAVSAAASGCF